MKDDEKERWNYWLEENKGVFFKIRWFRIILDEAQYVPTSSLIDSQLH
jgi:hypothetical protein